MSNIIGNIIGKVYRHVKTGLDYKVTAVGRSVEWPNRKVIVYAQTFESTLTIHEEDIPVPPGMNVPFGYVSGPVEELSLPVGSVWVRDEESFFEVLENGKPRFERVISNDTYDYFMIRHENIKIK